MNLTWSRVLAIGVVAVIVLGLGALEVFIGRISIDSLPPSPISSAAGGEPSRDLLEPVKFGALEGTVPGGRQTGARAANVGSETMVVTGDKKEADLALVGVAGSQHGDLDVP